ncbi:MAG TPA: hypothetical protein VG271_17900, partial [Beijerinckiaceae bacterium]|nr:hypothetical protein [Beijerinckiaceae bacterium]
MAKERWGLAALAATCLLSINPRARAQTSQADFYKGRQIRLIVGTEAGGGYDSYARVLARFIGKHIDGNPSVVVENMIGAGGVVAANYLYNAAPKDGTVIETFPNNTPFIKIMGEPGPLFDSEKFGWLGSLTSEST